MLIRLRWFVIGAASGFGLAAYAASQLMRARERLTPRNLARTGAYGVADLLDAAARSLADGAEAARHPAA